MRTRITFSCREPGLSTFLELADATDVLVSGAGAAAYDDGRIHLPDLADRNEITVEALLPKGSAWLAMFGTDLSNHEFSATSTGFWSSGQHELVAPYLRRYASQVPALVARRGQAFADVAGRVSFPTMPLPTADLEALRKGIADQVASGSLHATLARAWADAVDDLDVVLALR